jgi:K+-sensing histidine kinase KdpD
MAEKNYLEKYYFVEAEYSRILGNNRKAMKYYDLAIEAANKNKFIHFQAFINEYAARFYLSIKKKKEACFYLNEAIKKYLEWEAFAKVNQLNDNKDYVDLMLKYEPTDDCQDILNVSSTMFNDYSDKKQLLSKLMKTYMDIVSAQNVILFVINKNNCILCQKSKDHLNISEGERNKLFHQCDSLQKECINFTFEKHIKIIANSALEISSLASVFKQTMNAPLSIFCLPLIVEKNYIGVVYLENKKVKGLFTPGIIQKIEKFTSLAAVSINNAIQFKKIDCQNSKTKDSINKRSHVLYRSGQANKIGELASGVAHELNQPLSIINIHAGIIKGYFQKNDPVSTEIDKVSKIVNQIARTSEIVDNMLIFSRLKADGMEFTKTDEQLKNLLRFFYEEFRIQEIKYDVFINENLPLARINGQKFDQMIVHLILNAQYAVDEKAKVMGRSYEKYLSISLCFDDINKTIVFQISDNGIGMSHDILVNCVKPFYSTKVPGDGMGLGLFYVNMIVEKYKLILLDV